MADFNPFQSMLNPNAARVGLYDMRMMQSANRMEAPFERGMRSSYGRRGVSGDPMLAGLAGMANEPDYSQYTFDPQARAAASSALSPYGLAPLEASQVKRNALLPNTGFFGNHPRLSAAIEGGIFGAAASHGGETPGESIQGALEGVIGGHRIQQGLYRQQFARPFEAAGMLEGLEDIRQKRDLQEAEIQHLRAENQKAGRADHDFRPIGNAGPQDRFIPMYENTTGQTQNIPNPNYDPALVSATHRTPGAGTDFDRFVELRNQERKAAGKPPMNSSEILAARGQYMAAPVAPGEGDRQPYRNLQEARREHESKVRGLQAKLLKTDDPANQKLIQQQADDDYMSRLMSGEKNLGPPKPLTSKEVRDRVNQNNAAIQQQIDQENNQFGQDYPEALETPRNKSPRKQTGSAARIPTYDLATGTLR